MANASRISLQSIALSAVLFFCACETKPSRPLTNPRPPESATVAALRPGDSLVIILQGVPDPSSNQVQINEHGLITLPFIGPTQAAGATTASLGQHIRELYLSKKIYTKVDVSVSVTERYIYVGGEVAHPGRIIWTPDLTLTKAIQSAGGFSLYAKEKKVSLIREQQSYPIDATLAGKLPQEDPRLLPGDSIQVPKSAF